MTDLCFVTDLGVKLKQQNEWNTVLQYYNFKNLLPMNYKVHSILNLGKLKSDLLAGFSTHAIRSAASRKLKLSSTVIWCHSAELQLEIALVRLLITPLKCMAPVTQ